MLYILNLHNVICQIYYNKINPSGGYGVARGIEMRRWMRCEFWNILKFRGQEQNPAKVMEKELPLK